MSTSAGHSNRKKGTAGEDAAVQFLQKNGYTILHRNYYYQHGEIDIIARDGDVLVFVEVKMRRSTSFGMPEESVTPQKQELLRRTAEGFVLEKKYHDIPCRFDVVSVVFKEEIPEINIFRDCF